MHEIIQDSVSSWKLAQCLFVPSSWSKTTLFIWAICLFPYPLFQVLKIWVHRERFTGNILCGLVQNTLYHKSSALFKKCIRYLCQREASVNFFLSRSSLRSNGQIRLSSSLLTYLLLKSLPYLVHTNFKELSPNTHVWIALYFQFCTK